MDATTVTLTPDQSKRLRVRADQSGKSVDQLVHEAVESYLEAAEWHDRIERMRAACGMWKDRDDLPSLDELRAEWDGRLWDAQIEADAAAGKLDALAAEALTEYRAGTATEI